MTFCVSKAQNSPAANRAIIEDAVEASEFDRADVYEKQWKQKEEVKPLVQKTRKPKRSKFWSNFVGITGLLVWACGLGSFFLFGIIGWWVVLTALAGIILGSLLILQAEKMLGSDMAGIGAAFYGFLGIGLWLLGIVAIAIYSAIA